MRYTAKSSLSKVLERCSRGDSFLEKSQSVARIVDVLLQNSTNSDIRGIRHDAGGSNCAEGVRAGQTQPNTPSNGRMPHPQELTRTV